jgi:DNA-directed RNA polymerase specialized sigma24 family protein
LWAAPAYQRLRGQLVRIFARRGCTCPEDLADETISRVVARLPEVSQTYVGDPIRFFYGVARNVFREYSRRPATVPLDERLEIPASLAGRPDSKDEEAQDCLDRCLSKLSEADRRLIRDYYQFGSRARIEGRMAMAAGAGISINTLRVKAYRIRRRVSACARECKKSGATGAMK